MTLPGGDKGRGRWILLTPGESEAKLYNVAMAQL